MPVANTVTETKLFAVFDALLADGPLQERVNAANEHLSVLEFYKNELPDELWDQLVGLIGDLKRKVDERPGSICPPTPEQEAELAGRLLELYIEVNGGALVF